MATHSEENIFRVPFQAFLFCWSHSTPEFLLFLPPKILKFAGCLLHVPHSCMLLHPKYSAPCIYGQIPQLASPPLLRSPLNPPRLGYSMPLMGFPLCFHSRMALGSIGFTELHQVSPQYLLLPRKGEGEAPAGRRSARGSTTTRSTTLVIPFVPSVEIHPKFLFLTLHHSSVSLCHYRKYAHSQTVYGRLTCVFLRSHQLPFAYA